MPSYPWLFEQKLTGKDTAAKMEALRKLGVPFDDATIASARENVEGKYEIDALVAYLQALGKMHTVYNNKR
jgi:cytochrome c oxidase cbb3-type subunit 2